MEPMKTISGRVVWINKDNVDTDQIIPARFLKVTDKKGLGDCLFYDWRYDSQGKPKTDFILNRPQGQEAKFLIAGDNFGCGSSREHAPWALVGYGFAAVVSTSFADIFRNNSLKNRLLPIAVSPETHQTLLRIVAETPDMEWKVDLAAQILSAGSLEPIPFAIDAFSKKCLLQGMDEMEFIRRHEAKIAAYEGEHPPRVRVEPVESAL